MRATWSVNSDTGHGLLRLPGGWTPKTFQAATTEIHEVGWVVIPHDQWYAYLDRDSYYLLKPDPKQSPPEPKPVRRRRKVADESVTTAA